jgi:hypothetical protein
MSSEPAPRITVRFTRSMSSLVVTLPKPLTTTMRLDTCAELSWPVCSDLLCRKPAVLMSTPAAIAATSTIAMNTMSVPIPTCPRSSSSIVLYMVYPRSARGVYLCGRYLSRIKAT